MIDKSDFTFNNVISPETKYMHLMEAIEEVQLRFLLARLKGEIITIFGVGQSKISSKRWKKDMKLGIFYTSLLKYISGFGQLNSSIN